MDLVVLAKDGPEGRRREQGMSHKLSVVGFTRITFSSIQVSGGTSFR